MPQVFLCEYCDQVIGEDEDYVVVGPSSPESIVLVAVYVAVGAGNPDKRAHAKCAVEHRGRLKARNRK